jgi:hypothetical protein
LSAGAAGGNLGGAVRSQSHVGRPASHGANAAIAKLAARQHGNVTYDQLRGLDLSKNSIANRAKAGRLYRVHIGVYAVGRPPRTALEKASAAVLACGEGAALSHRSALALWGLTPNWPSRLEVTVPCDRRPKGIKVHRARLAEGEIRSHQGIKVTSLARTLLDCAPRLTDKALTRAVNDARRKHGLRLTQLADVADRHRNHPGSPRIRAFPTVRGGPTRSEWEDAFPAFCRRFGLPEPVMNTYVEGFEVDAVFVEEKLIVELDSWEFHSDRASFERDRDRDATTLAAGYGTVRITWERIHERPEAEAERLHQILRRRRREAA